MEKVKAPYTDEQVKSLNEFQNNGIIHPFTCCSPSYINECTRACKEIDGKIVEGTTDGLLVATKDGWICPCGKYKQDWSYKFMIKNK